jgi:hypothetical protein
MAISRLVLRRLLTGLLAAALLLGGCSPAPTNAPTATTPGTTQVPATATPGPSAPQAAEVYSEIRSAVAAIRGLQPTAAVDPVTIDETQLVANLTAEFDTENTAADLKFTEETLIALGLLPPGSSLRDLTLDFQGSNVAGYYSPDKDELFVVSRSGGLGPAEESTYSHEFTHQLQDQHFDLDKLGADATNQSDRALAQLGLVEGDAVSVQNRWMTANLTPQEMGQLVTAAFDPEALAALQRAPAYLRETALFPYLSGNAFVESLIAKGGGYEAVNAAFAKPPLSTEQILHPERYPRESPVEVKLPAGLAAKLGAGWTEGGQDTLGEFVLRLWLTQNGVPSATATAASAGWGGDRLALLHDPDGTVNVAIVTAWDTPSDAVEFRDAAQSALANSSLDLSIGSLASGSKEVVFAVGPKADRVVGALASR